MSLAAIHRPGRAEPASEIAAGWVLRQELGALSDDDQRRLEEWLAESLEHVEAYESAIWALDAAARHSGEPELKAMREAALAARASRTEMRWAGWAGFGAAAAFLLVLWAIASPPDFIRRATSPSLATAETVEPPGAYRTAVGERLSITLPDGSTATLDTDSRIRIAYSGRERGVHLLRGQALFEVASGKAIPFRVHARGQVITAVGTIFNVRLDREAVKVSLVEGTVRVRANPDLLAGIASSVPARPILLNAGESLEVRARQPIAVRREDVTQAAAWRTGRLVFNDTKLDEAVAEINRYTRQPISIEDGEVADHRVTGVFQSSDPERFSSAMAEVFPVDVSRRPDGSLSLHARPR